MRDIERQLQELGRRTRDEVPPTSLPPATLNRARSKRRSSIIAGAVSIVLLLSAVTFALSATDSDGHRGFLPADSEEKTESSTKFYVDFGSDLTAGVEIDLSRAMVCYIVMSWENGDLVIAPEDHVYERVEIIRTREQNTVLEISTERGCQSRLHRAALQEILNEPGSYMLLVEIAGQGVFSGELLTVAQASATVPDVVGLDVDTAQAVLGDAGFRMVVEEGSPRDGVITSQQPAPGESGNRWFPVGVTLDGEGQGQPPEAFALWPADTRAQAEDECADPDGAAAGGVGFTADPTSIALEFGTQVLGWEDAIAIPLDRTLEQDEGEQEMELRREPGDDAKRASGAAVRVWVREVQEDCWFVITVSRLPDNRPTGVGISIRGREVGVGFDDLGAASAMVKVGHGGRKRTAAWARGTDSSIEMTLPYEPDTSGHFLILFADGNGEIFSANGAPLPAGDFAAG